MCFSMFFGKLTKIEKKRWRCRTNRIIDIADISASQGALHYEYAMPVTPAGGDRIMDIA